MSAAAAALALGAVVAPPAALPIAVVALSTALAAVGAIVLGVARPRGGWVSGVERGPVVRVLAAHLTIVPAVLVAAAPAGLHVPDGAWVLALGPLPVASVSFAHLYGYSPPRRVRPDGEHGARRGVAAPRAVALASAPRAERAHTRARRSTASPAAMSTSPMAKKPQS
jgi:hypothetical protein